MAAHGVKPKFLAACAYCRAKKVKCEGGQPCTQCVYHGENCVFASARRARKKPSTNSNTMAQRLLRLESMIRTTPESPRNITPPKESMPASTANQNHTANDPRAPQAGQALLTTASPVPSVQMALSPISGSYPFTGTNMPQMQEGGREGHWNAVMADSPGASHSLAGTHFSPSSLSLQGTCTMQQEPACSDPGISASLPTPPGGTDTENTSTAPFAENQGVQENSSLPSHETTDWEYLGPRCFLSICSQPGIAWVSSKVEAPGVRESIMAFARNVTERLRLSSDEPMSAWQRTPEPPEELAQFYTKVFFEHALEAPSKIVERRWFEERLRVQYASNGRDNDASWYALRNTVYAIACRINTGRTDSYLIAVDQSLKLFKNALSAQTDMLYQRSSLTSLTALILMAYYCEGIGSPQLECTLTSSAMRLAISKGLHRQPPASWGLSQKDIWQQNRLFWSIYCLDRQISSRTGRPPTIDDDDISCEAPLGSIQDNNEGLVQYSSICVKLAQFYSRAYKRLSNAKALRQSTEELAQSIAELDQELQDYKLSVKNLVPLDKPLESAMYTSPVPRDLITIIYYLYYGLLLDIHTPLMLPWFGHADSTQHGPFRTQVERSCSIVAETARAAILGASFVSLNANSPVLSAVYVPFRAAICLFVYILKNPSTDSAQSDLVLMDIASGHASRVEFATQRTVSYPLMRQLSQFARTTVERPNWLAMNKPRNAASPGRAQISSPPAADISNSQQFSVIRSGSDQDFFNHRLDFDIDSWGTILPLGSFEDMNDDRLLNPSLWVTNE